MSACSVRLCPSLPCNPLHLSPSSGLLWPPLPCAILCPSSSFDFEKHKLFGVYGGVIAVETQVLDIYARHAQDIWLYDRISCGKTPLNPQGGRWGLHVPWSLGCGRTAGQLTSVSGGQLTSVVHGALEGNGQLLAGLAPGELGSSVASTNCL